MMLAMMMMLLVHGPHSTQQGPRDPTLWFHCWLAMAVLSDSIYCDMLSPGNNLTNSSKTMVLYWDSCRVGAPPPPNKGYWQMSGDMLGYQKTQSPTGIYG